MLKECPMTFDILIENKEYEARITLKYAVDNNYGADADGHRGTYMEFVEDMDLDCLTDIVTGQAIVDIDEDIFNAVFEEAESRFFNR